MLLNSLVLKEAYSPQQTRALYEAKTSKYSRICFWNTHSVYEPQTDEYPWHTTSQQGDAPCRNGLQFEKISKIYTETGKK